MSLSSFACKWAVLLALFSAPFAVANDGPGTAPLEDGERALAGRYSLAGDPGKKSRLELHANGRFDMSMARTGSSWQEKGIWRRKGDMVILTLDVTPDPLFGRGAATPWDGDAEVRMRRAEYDAEVSAVRRRCPFVGQLVVRAPPVAPVAGRMTPDEALEALKQAIGELETAATAYVLLDDGVDRDATLAAADAHARVAMMEFRARHEDAGDVYREAGRDTSSLPGPVLPAACRMPADIPQAAPAPEQWLGGYGVRVGDSATGLVFSEVKVIFGFKDGVNAEVDTDVTGWAGVRPRDVPLQSLIVQWCGAENICQALLVRTADAGHRVFDIRMRHESLLPPHRLELAVDADALVPQWDDIDGFQHGRYQRD